MQPSHGRARRFSGSEDLLGPNLVGQTCQVWWGATGRWEPGVIIDYNIAKDEYLVKYYDEEEHWEIIDDMFKLEKPSLEKKQKKQRDREKKEIQNIDAWLFPTRKNPQRNHDISRKLYLHMGKNEAEVLRLFKEEQKPDQLPFYLYKEFIPTPQYEDLIKRQLSVHHELTNFEYEKEEDKLKDSESEKDTKEEKEKEKEEVNEEEEEKEEDDSEVEKMNNLRQELDIMVQERQQLQRQLEESLNEVAALKNQIEEIDQRRWELENYRKRAIDTLDQINGLLEVVIESVPKRQKLE